MLLLAFQMLYSYRSRAYSALQALSVFVWVHEFNFNIACSSTLYYANASLFTNFVTPLNAFAAFLWYAAALSFSFLFPTSFVFSANTFLSNLSSIYLLMWHSFTESANVHQRYWCHLLARHFIIIRHSSLARASTRRGCSILGFFVNCKSISFICRLPSANCTQKEQQRQRVYII